MPFDQKYKEFLDSHLAKRTGERKRRLLADLYAERLFLKNVWWPIRKNLDYLHPEYEIFDWRGLPYYVDFAFIHPAFKFAIEIKGFGPHVMQTNRDRYAKELNRETFLQGLGWHVLSFSYDEIINNQDVCQTLVKFFLSNYLIEENNTFQKTNMIEREVLRFMCSAGGTVKPSEIAQYFNTSSNTIYKWLKNLTSKGWIQPIGKGERICKYQLKKLPLP